MIIIHTTSTISLGNEGFSSMLTTEFWRFLIKSLRRTHFGFLEFGVRTLVLEWLLWSVVSATGTVLLPSISMQKIDRRRNKPVSLLLLLLWDWTTLWESVTFLEASKQWRRKQVFDLGLVFWAVFWIGVTIAERNYEEATWRIWNNKGSGWLL